jgi:hypothetical protein
LLLKFGGKFLSSCRDPFEVALPSFSHRAFQSWECAFDFSSNLET